ncbi:MAG: hypothetical protein NEA02_06610 [Thermoanaerobaculia bacterium]|nr:hypothetical protein [Thermoanaerobaculia bacterium]
MNPRPIRADQAARHAVAALKRRGVRQIRLCALTWIAAGVGGALVDALGRLDSGESVYSAFRVGVRDGTEARKGRYKAGEEFVFIARGADRSGRIVWLPPPGPDYDPALHEFIGEYEYLDRESFEKLESTCR